MKLVVVVAGLNTGEIVNRMNTGAVVNRVNTGVGLIPLTHSLYDLVVVGSCGRG